MMNTAVETGTSLADVIVKNKMVYFNILQKAYEEQLVGKEFVYKSKYGSTTFGTVESVIVTSMSSMDDETGRKVKVGLSKVTPKVQIEEGDLEPIKVERTWVGSRPQISIISKNGTPYDLETDEIYFIDGKNTETAE